MTSAEAKAFFSSPLPVIASTPGFKLVEVETIWLWRWPKENDVGYHYRAISMDQDDDALIAYLRRCIDANLAIDAPRKCGKTMLFELVARTTMSSLHNSNKADDNARLLRALNGEPGRDIARRMPLLIQASLDRSDCGLM